MTFNDLVLIILILLVIGVTYNAREAHHHTHELACHVGHAELCSYAEGK